MKKGKFNLLGHDYDYMEDEYDRLKNLSKNKNQYKAFTNKANFKKIEFDYEEDPYEPEKGR
ncbi:hypothetical protein [Lutispora thermophila]|uniref:Uncharacterized protein n=1 Tax=Lutispora thermophila DSM 19022 TaxID=1122184 RepID=A0A1M6GV55_9FIRM|nr:hypothetical protein [Lutispora thermophila]SHJ13842.1 hypothetical protein SAMN02745176_02529 [Lutispora thermophila DSM 19022]